MTNCQRRRHHKAGVGEIMTVTGVEDLVAPMVLIGDKDEVACIPHQGCKLEIQATAKSSHPEADRLLPGQVISYIQVRLGWFVRRDLFLLPTAREVQLSQLAGFKLTLLPDVSAPPPAEEEILPRRERMSAESWT